MPGVHPGQMNGHMDYGRGGHERGFTNGHFDPYRREDPLRDEMRAEEDLYRRPVRNGGGRPANERFNNDHLADQSSLSDFNSSEPAFELDHLATFAAGGGRKGTMHVEDGLRKLRQMENTTGIWTMRCILLVERRFMVILDKNSGEELERFPVQHIQEPTAIFKNDRREIYNNLILFTVMDESNRKDPQADMHIFQSVRTPAQTIVDEIFAAKRGQARVSSGGYKIPPPPAGPAPEPPGPRGDPYDFGAFRETVEHRQYSQFNNGGAFIGGAQRSSMMARPSYLPYREKEDEVGSNELLERDVQLLNHCFDDIEKFVARLQQAAEAYKELERRKKERGGKGKKAVSGEGMLGHRARPPPAQDFVDIFQKFKLSFNLLAKLKAHIHDPNAPELVHFLFTPLSLIFEASRDPIHGSMNLGDQAVAPVITQDAKQLLQNCLTSKEIELWQALGKNWTTSKDEWKGYIPPYVPRFYDGWQPAPTLMDEPATRANLESAVAAHHDQIRNRVHEQDVREYVQGRVMPFPPEEDRFARDRSQDFDRFEPNPQAATPPRNVMTNANYRANQQKAPEPVAPPQPPVSQPPPQPQRPLDDNQAYLEELKRTGGVIYEVLHDRQGKNAKELTVTKGEYLQVLDSSRNWWKVRNFKGESGYCPYTILKEIVGNGGREGVNSGTDQTAAPSADKRGGKRDFHPDQPHMQYPGNQRDSPWFGNQVESPGFGDQVESPRYGSQGESPRYGGQVDPLGYGNQGESSRYADSQGTMSSTQFDDMDIQTLSMEEEEEMHAFRPVEPAMYNRGIKGIRQTQPQIALQNELKSKMAQGPLQRGGNSSGGYDRRNSPGRMPPTTSPPDSVTGAQPFYITTSSSQAEVADWLDAKGFSYECQQNLNGFTGRDLFSLHRGEMEQLIGHEEAARLEGQLTLQKKMTGYKTQSAAELNAIFQKRRARSDQQRAPLGQAPDFRPNSPSSFDDPDSDSDHEERSLGDTSKTLRDLLIRQRKKIIGNKVFDQQ